jgi:hypothetical protein
MGPSESLRPKRKTDNFKTVNMMKNLLLIIVAVDIISNINRKNIQNLMEFYLLHNLRL